MLYGGSRSGKTFTLVKAIIARACKVRSRHVILREKFNHCKTSIWLDTLPKVLKICYPDLLVIWNRSDYYLTLPNKSEVWIGGLDDEQRVEKILGKEYSTMYFNECSQLRYESVQTALTRLAEKNSLRKKAYYDENPPSRKHWSYWLWVKGLDPQEAGPIKKENYASLLMNPDDNLENIDEEYITEILDNLSEKEKLRFRFGEFVDSGEGTAYYAFTYEKNVRPVPKEVRIGTPLVGMDFNVHPMTSVVCHYINRIFYIVPEFYLENSNTPEMAYELRKAGFGGAWIYPDSTGKNRKTSGKSDHLILQEEGFIVKPTRNPIVFDRVNNLNRLFRDQRIVIDPSCKKLINDLNKVVWKGHDLDQKEDPMLTHISDALGYLCWAVDPMTYTNPKPIVLT